MVGLDESQDTGIRPHTASLRLPFVAMIDIIFALYPLLFGLFILVLVGKRKKPALGPYPPGPKGYPVLGNVLDLPMGVPIWESLTSLTRHYGTL